MTTGAVTEHLQGHHAVVHLQCLPYTIPRQVSEPLHTCHDVYLLKMNSVCCTSRHLEKFLHACLQLNTLQRTSTVP